MGSGWQRPGALHGREPVTSSGKILRAVSGRGSPSYTHRIPGATPGPSKILFVFKAKKSKVDAKKLSDALVFFRRFTDVAFARGAEQAAFALQEALAKLLVLKSRAARAGSPDPLGDLAEKFYAMAAERA